MKMLLSIFHVEEKSRTSFLHKFNTVDELLALYKKAFEGDMTQDEENDNVCELEASTEREDSSTSSVSNAILAEPEDKAEVTEVLVTDEEVSVCEEKIEQDQEETVAFGDDVSNIARKFQQLLNAGSVSEVIDLSAKGIELLNIKKRNCGSITLDQTFKSLQGRWFEKEDKSGEENVKSLYVFRNVLIRMYEGRGNSGELSFLHVLGVYRKSYNKWYIDSTKELWKKDLPSGKFRFYRRKMSYDHGFCSYLDEDATFLGKDVFVLGDGADIVDVVGYLEEE
jgi:hypothetical protein